MKILSKIKQLARKSIVLGVIAGAVMGAGLLVNNPAIASAESANCDANAVVWCGATGANSVSVLNSKYNNGDGHNSASSIHHIYDWFGISSSDINNMKSDSVEGSVTKSGDVIVNGQVVATDATTAGRLNINGSHKQSDGGTTFYTRPPSVSFKDKSLSAMVVMKDGVFQFAVLHSCGNPVIAHPKLPNYNIVKEVRVKGDSKYQHSVTVKSGTTVEYKITVSSTGAVPAKDITVSDNLPKNTTYTNNTLKRDGQKLTADKVFFTTGKTIDSLKQGTSTVYTFDAVIAANDTPEKCSPQTLDNEGTINAPKLPAKHGHAIVNKKCLPKPVFACTNLNAVASSSDDSTFKFTAQSNVDNGAKVKGYTFAFGDGTTKSVNSNNTSVSTNHTYAAPGTYNAVVTAIFNVDGTTKTDTGKACQVTVKIKKPVVPVFACTNLSAVADSRTMFTFNAAANASNGATITGYTFAFGDGTTKTVSSSASTAAVQHTYAAPGTYNAVVSALISVNGKTTPVTSSACKTTVTVKQAPAAECTGLTATVGPNNTVSVTAGVLTSGGATLRDISYDFGDNTAPVVTTATTASHTYATPGTFTIVATLSFDSAGSNVVPNSTCKAVVTFNAPQPTFQCDAFTVSQGDDRTVTVTAFSTSVTNGATFTSADINWGDDTAVTSASDVIGQTHQYAADGTFTIQAVAHFMVNGQDETAGGPNCQQQVTFNTPTPPVTPPTTPTTLVNTGAGNVIGLFSAVVIAGTFAYRWFLGRKLSRDS